MARAARTACVAALAAVCLQAPAHAAPPVQLLSNLLTISLASPTATLTTTGSSSTGSLGTTTVVDGRANATGYTVSVTTSGFDLVGPPVTTSTTTHIPPASASARVTATTNGSASTTNAAALPASPLFRLNYTGSVLSVDVTSTYTLSLAVTIPAPAAMGRYTGTVTQTIA